jgi:hypothetical protein
VPEEVPMLASPPRAGAAKPPPPPPHPAAMPPGQRASYVPSRLGKLPSIGGLLVVNTSPRGLRVLHSGDVDAASDQVTRRACLPAAPRPRPGGAGFRRGAGGAVEVVGRRINMAHPPCPAGGVLLLTRAPASGSSHGPAHHPRPPLPLPPHLRRRTKTCWPPRTASAAASARPASWATGTTCRSCTTPQRSRGRPARSATRRGGGRAATAWRPRRHSSSTTSIISRARCCLRAPLAWRPCCR